MKAQSRFAGKAMAIGMLTVAVLALGTTPAAQAQGSEITAQTLVDRAQIEDLLTRYYYNLGHSSATSFAAFYADDAELVLGTKSFRGKDGIEGAYKAAGEAPTPQRKAFAFNVLLSNPLIVVHGDTATARLIFTEIVFDTKGAAPRILTQGREFDHFVKVKGAWRFSKRQIMGAEQMPTDWTE